MAEIREREYPILEVCAILDIRRVQFDYLFQTCRLKKEDFPIHAGKRVFTKLDILRIRKALKTIKKTDQPIKSINIGKKDIK